MSLISHTESSFCSQYCLLAFRTALRRLLAVSSVRKARFSFTAELQASFHHGYPEFWPNIRLAEPFKALLMDCMRPNAALSRSVVEGVSVREGSVLQFSISRSMKSFWSSVSIRSLFGES